MEGTTEIIILKVVTKASVESPRGPEMEAVVNEDMGEMDDQNSLSGDRKYRAIVEV